MIKYRVWDKGRKKMFPVAAIHFGDDGSALTVMIDPAPKGLHVDLVDGENAMLLQFTRLKDRNGDEIYEGDVVDFLDNTSQGFVMKTAIIEDICSLPDFSCSKWQEVAGNVYENPELLNVPEA